MPASWAVLLDSGYIGPASDTPNLRKIALPRPSSLRSAADRERSVELVNVFSCVLVAEKIVMVGMVGHQPHLAASVVDNVIRGF